ncbi:MAG: hypothetical protein K8U57_36830 [Planctomycetes bacterium]|nr:hypothetical protein [Planctomycetota bacterium]
MKLYRLMKADADGKPLVGDGSMMLGVRPTDPTQPKKRADVPAVIGTDVVHPGGGGLSCYTDPSAIKIQSDKLILWSIDTDELPSEFTEKPAGVPHYHIEPSRDITLDDLQELVADTRDLWQRETKGANP